MKKYVQSSAPKVFFSENQFMKQAKRLPSKGGGVLGHGVVHTYRYIIALAI